MLKIKPRMMHGRWSRKLGTYGAERDLFAKYSVKEVRLLKGGYTSIEIVGPKKSHFLMSCARPLTIISPPLNEGENARKREVPLYFVSPMHGSGKIQGAEYFAEIDGELVAYRPAGGGTITEL